jgi:hypothetical protein
MPMEESVSDLGVKELYSLLVARFALHVMVVVVVILPLGPGNSMSSRQDACEVVEWALLATIG